MSQDPRSLYTADEYWCLLLPQKEGAYSVHWNTAAPVIEAFCSCISSEFSSLIPSSKYKIKSVIPTSDLGHAYLTSSSDLQRFPIEEFRVVIIPRSVLPFRYDESDQSFSAVVELESGSVLYQRTLTAKSTLITSVPSVTLPKTKGGSSMLWSDSCVRTERMSVSWNVSEVTNQNVFIARVAEELFHDDEIKTGLGLAKSIWTAGLKGWRKLAAQGFFVTGTTESLPLETSPLVTFKNLYGKEWVKLTHTIAEISHPFFSKIIPYYEVQRAPIESDVVSKSHFYWHSGSMLRTAVTDYPSLLEKFHSTGLGDTCAVAKEILPADRFAAYVDETSWREAVL